MVTIRAMEHHDSKIIDLLGGNTALSKVFGISSQAVSKWRRHGIPKANRMYLKLANPAAFEADESERVPHGQAGC